MSDQIFDKVGSDTDFFKKILKFIPGFGGYVERQKRHRTQTNCLGKPLRIGLSSSGSEFQLCSRDFISQGDITYVDDLESAAIKLRTFTDRVRRASRGYSGLFDAVKINEKELEQVYQYDATLLELMEEVGRAIDNVETSVGSDGLPASLRNRRALLSNVSTPSIVAMK